jgi:uncharacterized protein YraI
MMLLLFLVAEAFNAACFVTTASALRTHLLLCLVAFAAGDDAAAACYVAAASTAVLLELQSGPSPGRPKLSRFLI